ncbi:ATP-binding protein [Streptomyces sp. DSM 42041]|uniref:histidine kinase n=1 Tax=Streptomyces hazeniae TaxID=3075538 RepID=A0ABU2NPX2_9ACTN|nr:ATP-binding protein [Streptomyces sp. DSM 42041]MDT0378263.1 ATP-binding protein [Streptomyces sp. DSM 42041]
MSVPVTPRPRRNSAKQRMSPAAPLLLLVVAAVVGGAVTLAAPGPATGWVLAVVVCAWLGLAAATAAAVTLVRQARSAAEAARREARAAARQAAQHAAEAGHLLQVTVPAVLDRLTEGGRADETLAATPQPSDPQLRRLLHTFVSEVGAAEERALSATAAATTARVRLEQAGGELDRLTATVLPTALAGLRNGASADTVLAGLERPQDARLRALLESLVREFARSERRAAAAQGASAKALSRVQAKAVGMLADLREMQDRYGEDVFGDLLRLDHNTSQLGLMTDRLALLMGGRTSRSWNKPIGMESILRGAMGRIAAYQRVRLHCSSTAAIAGFAAEAVMHLLAELMDNAANFSPPIDEVHVYVEERSAGIVVTIEDSGLKMADAAMRRAEEAVSGRCNDLALLQGTRLGLAVVGRVAAKYHMTVNFRPSSRGGTGVVVLFPPQLLAQRRTALPEHFGSHLAQHTPPHGTPAAPADAVSTPGTHHTPDPLGTDDPAPRTPETPPERSVPDPVRPAPLPAQATGGDAESTPGGLPVRSPGRTMATADREHSEHLMRRRAASPAPSTGGTPRHARDAGTGFGAFHRARRGQTDASPTPPE